jgi:hypothetical protein
VPLCKTGAHWDATISDLVIFLYRNSKSYALVPNLFVFEYGTGQSDATFSDWFLYSSIVSANQMLEFQTGFSIQV